MRGLKYIWFKDLELLNKVALLVSAWIEINGMAICNGCHTVALLVSAWIEIQKLIRITSDVYVALLVSAWIEII